MSLGPKRSKKGEDLEPKDVICQYYCRVFVPSTDRHDQQGSLQVRALTIDALTIRQPAQPEDRGLRTVW